MYCASCPAPLGIRRHSPEASAPATVRPNSWGVQAKRHTPTRCVPAEGTNAPPYKGRSRQDGQSGGQSVSMRMEEVV